MARVNASIVAPMAAFGATWAARKIMTVVYEKRTGHLPPAADDPEVSLRRVILWSIATAMVSAAIEVVIVRIAADRDAGALTADTNNPLAAAPVSD